MAPETGMARIRIIRFWNASTCRTKARVSHKCLHKEVDEGAQFSSRASARRKHGVNWRAVRGIFRQYLSDLAVFDFRRKQPPRSLGNTHSGEDGSPDVLGVICADWALWPKHVAAILAVERPISGAPLERECNAGMAGQFLRGSRLAGRFEVARRREGREGAGSNQTRLRLESERSPMRSATSIPSS